MGDRYYILSVLKQKFLKELKPFGLRAAAFALLDPSTDDRNFFSNEIRGHREFHRNFYEIRVESRDEVAIAKE